MSLSVGSCAAWPTRARAIDSVNAARTGPDTASSDSARTEAGTRSDNGRTPSKRSEASSTATAPRCRTSSISDPTLAAAAPTFTAARGSTPRRVPSPERRSILCSMGLA